MAERSNRGPDAATRSLMVCDAHIALLRRKKNAGVFYACVNILSPADAQGQE